MVTEWLLALATAGTSLTPACNGLTALRSGGDRPVAHVFQNGGKVPLRLSWIDPQGIRRDVGIIAPGAIQAIQTYVGHAFVLTESGGWCRAAVRVGDVLSGTYVGTSRYRAAAIPGWHVYLDRALEAGAEPATGALTIIERVLRGIDNKMPTAIAARLRRTPIFLHERSGSAAMFHPDAEWLVAHGRTVELTRGIEISDAAIFVEDAAVRPEQLFHELAHAYHWQLPPDDRAAIDAAYRHAMAAGLYQHVARRDGSVGPAYAGYSAPEYFAELSEAWFGTNDFGPFTRSELSAYDPDGARLIERLWR